MEDTIRSGAKEMIGRKLANLNPETSGIIKRFLNDIRVNGQSENTITAYLSVLPAFFQKVDKKIAEITRDDVFSWFSEYRIDKAPKTINNRLALIKVFFDYCIDEEKIIQDNPVYYKWRAKEPKTLPRHLSISELTKLKVYMENLPIRDRAILHVLLDTGIRNSELVSLTVDDISFEDRTITLNTKGHKKLFCTPLITMPYAPLRG